MPLTARHPDRGHVDSTDDEQWDEVRCSRSEGLYCPECRHPMHATSGGEGRIRHFRHAAGRPDTCSLTAAESPGHLHTKKLVAEAARTLGWTAELECPVNGRRADVLAISPSGERRIAFEPQFSYIYPEEARKRSEAHRAGGVETLWLDKVMGEYLANERRVRLHYDERNPRVGVQAFEGRSWGPRPLALALFVQRFCLGQMTYTEGRWAGEQDRQAAARHAHEEAERCAEVERQAEARREWHRKHAEEREAHRQREQERIDREIAEQRMRRDRLEAERRAQEERDRPAREAAAEVRREAEAVAEREAQERRKQEEARREAEWRATNPWHPANAASDEELLTLAKHYAVEPMPFPGWILAGERLHAALASRGLLHD